MNERCFENRMARNGRNYKNEVRLLPNRGCATLCTFPGDSCMQHNLTVKDNNFYFANTDIVKQWAIQQPAALTSYEHLGVCCMVIWWNVVSVVPCECQTQPTLAQRRSLSVPHMEWSALRLVGSGLWDYTRKDHHWILTTTLTLNGDVFLDVYKILAIKKD